MTNDESVERRQIHRFAAVADNALSHLKNKKAGRAVGMWSRPTQATAQRGFVHISISMDAAFVDNPSGEARNVK